VARDARSAKALECLAEVIESNQPPIAQLETYKTVCTEFPAVSELLKSSHVRMPTGAGGFTALYPGVELIVKHARIVRTGLKAALKEATRKMVPPSANASDVIASALAGALFSCEDGSIAHLGSSVKAKLFLGIVAKPLSDKVANSRAELLVLALKAIPLIGGILERAHPDDESIGLTMLDVLSTFARGVAVRSVPEAVAGVLVPLFRAYEEAFGRFQKSATQGAPSLGDVWEREQLAPTVMAFVSLIGTSEASRGSSGAESASELTAALAAADKRISELEKKAKRAPTAPPKQDVAAAPPKQINTPADPNSKRSKEKARLQKEAADGDGGGALPAAPSGP
jgi:hypothetical protein